MIDFRNHGCSVRWGFPFEISKEKQGIRPMRWAAVLVIYTVSHNLKVSTVTVFNMVFFHMRVQITLTRKDITITFSAQINILSL